MSRLMPYGCEALAGAVAKVGKKKTPFNLASRMPSPEIAAKVGGAQHWSIRPDGQERSRRIVRRRPHA